MSEYDSEYFFIRKPRGNEKIPYLTPNANTLSRRFGYEAQPQASAPLVFTNANRDENKAAGITSIAPDILFSGSDLVVRTPIREKLLLLNVPHLAIHPVIYIDDREKWHEDYWYLTFTEEFDCWDRQNSEYDDEAMEVGSTDLFQVYSYRLNADLLDRTPLAQRQLFKMGGDIHGFICCHKSLRALFSGGGESGARLESLADQ